MDSSQYIGTIRSAQQIIYHFSSVFHSKYSRHSLKVRSTNILRFSSIRMIGYAHRVFSTRCYLLSALAKAFYSPLLQVSRNSTSLSVFCRPFRSLQNFRLYWLPHPNSWDRLRIQECTCVRRCSSSFRQLWTGLQTRLPFRTLSRELMYEEGWVWNRVAESPGVFRL